MQFTEHVLKGYIAFIDGEFRSDGYAFTIQNDPSPIDRWVERVNTGNVYGLYGQATLRKLVELDQEQVIKYLSNVDYDPLKSAIQFTNAHFDGIYLRVDIGFARRELMEQFLRNELRLGCRSLTNNTREVKVIGELYTFDLLAVGDRQLHDSVSHVPIVMEIKLIEHSFEAEELVQSKLTQVLALYPSGMTWWATKFTSEWRNGLRSVAGAYLRDQLIGVVLYKSTPTENKICSVAVDELYRYRYGIGTAIIRYVLDIIPGQVVDITVPEENDYIMGALLRGEGFTLIETMESRYRDGVNEYFYRYTPPALREEMAAVDSESLKEVIPVDGVEVEVLIDADDPDPEGTKDAIVKEARASGLTYRKPADQSHVVSEYTVDSDPVPDGSATPSLVE